MTPDQVDALKRALAAESAAHEVTKRHLSEVMARFEKRLHEWRARNEALNQECESLTAALKAMTEQYWALRMGYDA